MAGGKELPPLRLAAIDVNLLVALDALLREAHVTRAAARVGLSQSAMSHALTRLRDLLDDPILVRRGTAMTLTARARDIAAPLAEALGSLERSLGPPPAFDPSRLRREFRIAAIDFGQLVLVPPLSMALARDAPEVTLTVFAPAEPIARALVDGTVDLAIGLSRDAPSLNQRDLLEERFVCVVRRGHPGVRQRLTAKRLSRLPHALVSPRGRTSGAVDVALGKAGLSRRVVLTAPHMLTAALAVARSDMVLTVAERVARIALRGLPLAILEPPLALSPFRVTMLWHARHDTDAGHTFLRDRLVEIAKRS
jgi:DNA-binding transcriptional LysR family regulator